MQFPDFHRGRDPVPFTRKEFESWARQRDIGQSKFVRKATIASGVTFAIAGIIAVGMLYWFLDRGTAASWLVFTTVSVLSLSALGAFLGWLISMMIWSISETRFKATSPTDLDNKNLEAGKTEQDWMAVSGIPFLLGLIAVLIVPEKFASLGFVGFGITMMWFSYILLSSKVEPAKNSEAVSRPKTWVIFLVGLCFFVGATYHALKTALSLGN